MLFPALNAWTGAWKTRSSFLFLFTNNTGKAPGASAVSPSYLCPLKKSKKKKKAFKLLWKSLYYSENEHILLPRGYTKTCMIFVFPREQLHCSFTEFYFCAHFDHASIPLKKQTYTFFCKWQLEVSFEIIKLKMCMIEDGTGSQVSQ